MGQFMGLSKIPSLTTFTLPHSCQEINLGYPQTANYRLIIIFLMVRQLIQKLNQYQIKDQYLGTDFNFTFY